jgi:hypothetical protein
VELPDGQWTPDTTGYNASPECESLNGEVAAYTHLHAARLGHWHQTCVDAYGAQHISERTRPITAAFALNGLYLVLERGLSGFQARQAHGFLARTVNSWPHFTAPPTVGQITVFDVALASSPEEHIELVQRWGRSVWSAWHHVHDQVAEMTDRQLNGWHPRPTSPADIRLR